MTKTLLTAASALALTIAPAHAAQQQQNQDRNQAQTQDQQRPVKQALQDEGVSTTEQSRIGQNQGDLALGTDFLAKQIMNSDVYGQAGDDAGSVQSIVIGQDGVIDRLVIQTGGFLGIGDKVTSVPWNEVDLTRGEDGIRVPIDASNLDEYSFTNDQDTAQLSERRFRASDVIGDALAVQADDGGQGEAFGLVTDLRFSQEGELMALVFQPDVQYEDYDGSYESRWHGYAPGAGWYDFDASLPYVGVNDRLDEIENNEIDYYGHSEDI